MKPSVFIGSSKEGIEVARAIRTQLHEDAEITIWNEGDVFQLTKGYLEALVSALPNFDFAILVLSADDCIESRGVTSLAPRDNVLFELGLFMGRLGRERTFAICDKSHVVKLASDLAGVSLAGYLSPKDGNFVRAVGVATDQIRNVIKSLGIHEMRAQSISNNNDYILDKMRSEKLIRLHQASAAYRIARVIDSAIDLISRDSEAFDADIFFAEIRTALLKSREYCQGFASSSLGNLYEYFERKFPASELRPHVEMVVPKLLDVGDSVVRRKKLFDIVSTIQAEVFAKIIEDLSRKTTS